MRAASVAVTTWILVLSLTTYFSYAFKIMRPLLRSGGSASASVLNGGNTDLPDDVISPMELLKKEDGIGLNAALKKPVVKEVGTWNGLKQFVGKLGKVFDPLEVVGFLILYRYQKQILRKLHIYDRRFRSMVHESTPHEEDDEIDETGQKVGERKHYIHGVMTSPDSYEASIFGHLESPISYGMTSIGLLYIADVAFILLHFLGIKYRKDLPRLVFKVLNWSVLGSFMTRVKDYALSNIRLRTSLNKSLSLKKRKRDPVREGVIDELSSTVIWAGVILFMVEQLSLEFGFALKSVFAVGSIGSATVILALRSTFENLVGGLLLKVQDRFRRGEKISVGTQADGWVEEIGLVNTIIRRIDNTRVAVPNNNFVTGEVVNWSRTPFRIYQNHIYIPWNDVDVIDIVCRSIRKHVSEVEGLADITDRPLLVAATDFEQNLWHDESTPLDMHIKVDITCHMITQPIQKLAKVKTAITLAIASGIKEGLTACGKAKSSDFFSAPRNYGINSPPPRPPSSSSQL